MCRKKQMQGMCCVSLGLGLMVGCWLESWLICSLGGLLLIVCGMMIGKK